MPTKIFSVTLPVAGTWTVTIEEYDEDVAVIRAEERLEQLINTNKLRFTTDAGELLVCNVTDEEYNVFTMEG